MKDYCFNALKKLTKMIMIDFSTVWKKDKGDAIKEFYNIALSDNDHHKIWR